MYCLWVYDYLLTLGDEVWYLRSSAEVSGSDRWTGRIRLDWEKIVE